MAKALEVHRLAAVWKVCVMGDVEMDALLAGVATHGLALTDSAAFPELA